MRRTPTPIDWRRKFIFSAMPFTFSHPAIVLPFLRIKHQSLSMSGLIIGSLTPDFEYFIRMKLSGRYSHSLEGMFLLDVPVAIVIAVIFHQLVKRPLIDNLPGYFYGRLLPLRDFNFPSYLRKHFWGFLLCLVVGIGSHIFWDGFTHSNEFFVERIAFLSTPITIGGTDVPLFRYLQHFSTFLGGIAIVFVFHQSSNQIVENKPSYRYWLITVFVAAIMFSLRALLTFEYFGDIVASIISSVLTGLIVSSLIYRFRNG